MSTKKINGQSESGDIQMLDQCPMAQNTQAAAVPPPSYMPGDCPVESCRYNSAKTKKPSNSMDSHLRNHKDAQHAAAMRVFTQGGFTRKMESDQRAMGQVTREALQSDKKSLTEKVPPADKKRSIQKEVALTTPDLAPLGSAIQSLTSAPLHTVTHINQNISHTPIMPVNGEAASTEARRGAGRAARTTINYAEKQALTQDPGFATAKVPRRKGTKSRKAKKSVSSEDEGPPKSLFDRPIQAPHIIYAHISTSCPAPGCDWACEQNDNSYGLLGAHITEFVSKKDPAHETGAIIWKYKKKRWDGKMLAGIAFGISGEHPSGLEAAADLYMENLVDWEDYHTPEQQVAMRAKWDNRGGGVNAIIVATNTVVENVVGQSDTNIPKPTGIQSSSPGPLPSASGPAPPGHRLPPSRFRGRKTMWVPASSLTPSQLAAAQAQAVKVQATQAQFDPYAKATRQLFPVKSSATQQQLGQISSAAGPSGTRPLRQQSGTESSGHQNSEQSGTPGSSDNTLNYHVQSATATGPTVVITTEVNNKEVTSGPRADAKKKKRSKGKGKKNGKGKGGGKEGEANKQDEDDEQKGDAVVVLV